jgi:hypothetical protein
MRLTLLALLGAISVGLSIPTNVSAFPVNGALADVAAAAGVQAEPVVVCRSVRERVCAGGVCRTRVVRRCV